jgi:hypothetical protein
MRLHRSDWPTHQLAAAVGAYVHEYTVGAISAPSALVRADPRVVRLRRKVTVAEFAVGTQFQCRHRFVCIAEHAPNGDQRKD